MTKFNPKDTVVIYKNTPTFLEGTVGLIIDSDPNDGSFLVAELQDVGKSRGDLGRLYEMAKWVKPENMNKVSFDKKKKDTGLIFSLSLFAIAVATSVILVRMGII